MSTSPATDRDPMLSPWWTMKVACGLALIGLVAWTGRRTGLLLPRLGARSGVAPGSARGPRSRPAAGGAAEP